MILEKEFDSETEIKIIKSALNAVAEYKGIKLSLRLFNYSKRSNW